MDTSKAASLLGSICTEKKSKQSRLNGMNHKQGRYYFRTRCGQINIIDRTNEQVVLFLSLKHRQHAVIFRNEWNKFSREWNKEIKND